MTTHIGLLYITIFILFLLVFSTKRSNLPCWCTHIDTMIVESRKRLLSRYKQVNLDVALTYSSSGINNPLEHRLLESLNTGKAFKIGIMGGMYSFPEPVKGNAWSFNVTRWLNKVLSASQCVSNPGFSVKGFFDDDSKCQSPKNLRISYRVRLADQIFSKEPVVFCSEIATYTAEASYHNNVKPIDHICDMVTEYDTASTRTCRVFGGSGKYAQLAMTSSRRGGRWAIQNLGIDDVDMIIWDYSVNDLSNPIAHKQLYEGFFEQALFQYQNLSAFLFMYQNSHLDVDKSTPGHVIWNDQLAVYDAPLLETIFEPNTGKLANYTLLTTSIPSYCKQANCLVSKFINEIDGIPEEQGIAATADIVIWQLLGLFSRIYQNQCNGNHNTGHSPALKPWTMKGAIAVTAGANTNHPVRMKKELQSFIESHTNDIIDLNHKKISSWNIVASMQFQTPIIKQPLPVDQFALLCTPPYMPLEYQLYPTMNRINVFDLQTNISLMPINWIPVDIMSIMHNHCAGFNHFGERKSHRIDDFYCYSGLVSDENFHCLPKSLKMHRSCPVPVWNSTTFPHPYWPHIPMAKSSDLIFRVSSSLDFDHVCFLNCRPKIFWRNPSMSTGWEEKPLPRSGPEVPGELALCFNVVEIQYLLRKSNIAEFYIWYPSDSCFPVRKSHHACQLNKYLYLLKPG